MNGYVFYHLAGIAILLCCSFFFSCTETTLFSLSPFKVKKLQREHAVSGPLVARLLANPRRLLISILIGNMFVNIFASALGESFMRSLIPGAEGTLVAIFVMSFAILVAGEVTPKIIAIHCNERLAPLVAPVINAIGIMLYPIRHLVRLVSDMLIALISRRMAPTEPAITEDELKTAIRIGSREGIVDPQEKNMIQGVFDFATARVSSVMRPRREIVAFEVRHPLVTIEETIRAHEYSRIPIYEGEFDNIIGILYAKDLLAAQRLSPVPVLKAIIRPALFVPETKTASSLLNEFRKKKIHIAMVMDEYGTVSGLVTLEDLLEKIVGEIRDKRGDGPRSQQLEKDSFRIDARMGIGEFNQLLGADIRDPHHATIGGFLSGRIGRIPRDGYRFRHGGLSFTILAADRNRIREIMVRREIAP